jgi:hypothetical protein
LVERERVGQQSAARMLMITKVEGSGYVSDSGFSVEPLGRTGLWYREGERLMYVYCEINGPGMGISVWPKTIQAWKPPFDGENITEADRERILANIGEAIAFTKQPLVVIR